MPDSEKRLWHRLRGRQIEGYKFRRQYPIDKYIVDFASIGAHLVVEIDGDHHGNVVRERLDLLRDATLAQHGWRTIRFWSSQLVDDIDGVIDAIRDACVTSGRPEPHPSPPRWRGEGTSRITAHRVTDVTPPG